MYNTFAVQSGESARQQRLAIVLSSFLLWSNRAVIHLENDDSSTNPRPW
jgi:alpha-ketoglutarate-dependent taurine dioxygenase